MKAALGRLRSAVMAALAGLLVLSALPAQAHLMAGQKGSLNLVGDGGFLVLSVPVSAFTGVDDDADGRLSREELKRHDRALRAQLDSGVQLLGTGGAAPLQLMMLDLAPHDGAAAAADRHLVVLGRFALDAGGPARTASSVGAERTDWSLRFALFGTDAAERQQDITITRGEQTQWLRFVPGRHTQAVLPGAWSMLGSYAQRGAGHVLGGADHLLFLLVVLAAGWSTMALLATLSAFTVGHATTLALSVWTGWQAPSAWVEPAIAATLIGMAGLDAWSRWRSRPAQPALRLTLVFMCALIHGLGLAEALQGLTAWPRGSAPQLWALLGFNLGIEGAQVLVAVAAGLAYRLQRVLAGEEQAHRSRRWAGAAAMMAGVFWLVERVAQSV